MSLRLVSYNIRYGGGRRQGLIADVLGALEPDVVVLEEATKPSVVDWIAKRLGMRHVAARAGHSVAAMSRVPLGPPEWRRFRRGRAMLDLELPDHSMRVLGIHLSSGMSWRGERVRIVEAGRLLEWLEASAPKGLGVATPGPGLAAAAEHRPVGPGGAQVVSTGPRLPAPGDEGGPAAGVHVGADSGRRRPPERTVITGDFNSVAPGDAPVVRRMPLWLRLLLRFDGGIHTRVIQMFLDAGFVDAFRWLQPDELGFTLPALDPSVRLDYLMVGSDLVDDLRACAPVRPEGLASPLLLASDHLPLLAVLDNPRRGSSELDISPPVRR